MVSRGMVPDYKLPNSSKVIGVYDSDCFAKSLSFLACVLTEIPSLTPEQVQTGSSYLAEKTFQSLEKKNEMLINAMTKNFGKTH